MGGKQAHMRADAGAAGRRADSSSRFDKGLYDSSLRASRYTSWLPE
jgi:hypothetical protein